MSNEDGERAIPLFEERISVGKTEVVTDQLQVSTSVEERHVLIEDLIERGDLRVERIAVDRQVDAAPEPRQEGDTLVVSIVAERVFIEKRLFVVEELRIVRTSTTETVAIPETIRTMRATIEHSTPAPTTRRDIDG